MPTFSTKMTKTISGTGVTDACEMSGPFSVYIANPSGSSVKVEYSADNVTFRDFIVSGSPLAYSSAACDVINNRGTMWFRWNCTSYGSTPFELTMAGH